MISRGVLVLNENDEFYINYDILNGRTAKLTFSCPVKSIIYNDIYIFRLKINDRYISIGDTLSLKIGDSPTKFYVSRIEHFLENSFLIFSSTPTKTFNFLIPTISDNYSKDYFLLDSFLENAYLYNKEPSEILLTYRYSDNEIYQNFINQVESHPNYLKTIQVNESLEGIVFSIDSKFLNDAKHFVNGKYSKFSNTLKSKIISFYQLPKKGKMYDILMKTEKRRRELEQLLDVQIDKELELFSIPEIEEELYEQVFQDNNKQ